MDKSLRNSLRIIVTQARKILEEAVKERLQGQFGIRKDGRIEPETAMGHLSEDDKHYREQILAYVKHMQATGFTVQEAVAQIVRAVAFTHLNRLCAYKMMEKRGLVRETVSRSLKSTGFYFYLADHPEDEQLSSGGKQDLAYRHFIEWNNARLSEEIGVLFAPSDPANRLFPAQRVLDEVLTLINSDELRDIWSEDETIGWVYQYFTPKELRDTARNESQAPRNSYELAFRNQFYTPSYVVHFLTDNTLGRIWYEMRQGQTALKEQCRYLVRRPDEVFLAEAKNSDLQLAQQWLQGENVPEPSDLFLAHSVNPCMRTDKFYTETEVWLNARLREIKAGCASQLKTQELLDCLFFIHANGRSGQNMLTNLQAEIEAILAELRKRVAAQRNDDRSQEELLRAPFFVAYREVKDPREIKILDPACGSGHFLLYCFDLLISIYLEAYAAAPVGSRLKQDYRILADLQRALPSLILSHNLHGIDIDPRATQIASLALWLRAQRSYHDLHVEQAEQARIRKSNIVCAEPMPGEQDMLEEFTSTLQPQMLGKLVQIVFDKMKLASDAGSLLKIEEEIKETVLEAKQLWLNRSEAEQLKLWSEQENAIVQQRLTETGITDTAFWGEAEEKVIEALHAYATSVSNGKSFARQLFADDAVRGFAFIDICQKRFDVVLMNPPFGESSKPSKTYIEHNYPYTKNDIYAAFVERWLGKLVNHGTLGAITSRTGFFLTSFQKWREEILLKGAKPIVFADLGHGILDTAMVGTAAYCLETI
jgi:hypothetical protein